ncbi:coproporphyrinogen III oxidase [Brevibacillus daliensis]|uniref:coproporphyrinogen III oxidase n=1 Tax=Brevibacillus daliensis TaxID=2892995 RepID=UPI001E386479|nr:coproporphyrinogen III oxidase [Brevibacillus daliensis]
MLKVKCIGHQFEREIGFITALFYEEPQISYVDSWEDISQEELKIELVMEPEEHGVHVFGRLLFMDKEDSFDYERSYQDRTEKGMRKTAKQAVSYTLLTLLERHTGMTQGWGILTGIRPSKLLHSMLKSKMTRDDAHKRLREDYMVRPHKLQLLQGIVDRQLEIVPDLYNIDREVSIYIGIPFCPTKCAYCTFPAYAIGAHRQNVNPFLEGLHYEIRALGEWLTRHDLRITSIYFGGGTPTSISADELDSLFVTMFEKFPHMEQVRELTVEAGRPDTITEEKLEVMKKWKVTRISINPQSFTQETLQAIGRHHTVEETIDTYHMAMELGVTNINMDLIIGLPNEGINEMRHSLEQTAELLPTSVTVHTLSFKRASEMTQNRDKYKVADREEIMQMMEMTEEWAKEHDYVPYYLYRQKNILGNLENVGYARENQDSIYNIVMMEEVQTILGLGCGAVSKFMKPGTTQLTRWPNPKDPKTYNDTYKELVDRKIKDLDELYGKMKEEV